MGAKGAAKTKGSGRTKGTPNKVSKNVRDTVLSVFDDMGGEAAFKLIADSDPTWFYVNFYKPLLPKPLEISGPEGKPISPIYIPLKMTELEYDKFVEHNKKPAKKK